MLDLKPALWASLVSHSGEQKLVLLPGGSCRSWRKKRQGLDLDFRRTSLSRGEMPEGEVGDSGRILMA